MNYKYGIVIVTYNRLPLLKECIEHAVNQTVPASTIIIVNNSSTDGTTEYLKQFEDDERFIISHEKSNLGGAGGFAKGTQMAYREDIDWIMLIDDDAILDYDCMERLDPSTADNNAAAYACTVVTDGSIDVSHRRNVDGSISLSAYDGKEFFCDLATFCGLMFKKDLINHIGFPEDRYFIWFDDSEYCLRINCYSKIVVRTKAKLNHKTKLMVQVNQSLSAFQWKDYYGLRNSIHAYKKHGYKKEYWNSVKQTIKQIVKCYLNVGKDKRCVAKAKMLCTALLDATFDKLGKNDNYLPGMKF